MMYQTIKLIKQFLGPRHAELILYTLCPPWFPNVIGVFNKRSVRGGTRESFEFEARQGQRDASKGAWD
jgi:hypothetical protein